jgi:hypothetical protein
MAIWKERSIESIGYELDFYVHMNDGMPVSVETDINRRIETPISQSDTWAKITSGRTEALDKSDRPILYALIRHPKLERPTIKRPPTNSPKWQQVLIARSHSPMKSVLTLRFLEQTKA